MTATEEREALVHKLSELFTVALANCGPLRDEIFLLKGGRQPALDLLTDMEEAIRKACDLFPELRRVL